MSNKQKLIVVSALFALLILCPVLLVSAKTGKFNQPNKPNKPKLNSLEKFASLNKLIKTEFPNINMGKLSDDKRVNFQGIVTVVDGSSLTIVINKKGNNQLLLDSSLPDLIVINTSSSLPRLGNSSAGNQLNGNNRRRPTQTILVGDHVRVMGFLKDGVISRPLVRLIPVASGQ